MKLILDKPETRLDPIENGGALQLPKEGSKP